MRRKELIRPALLAGGPDNVTCVVADIVSPPAAQVVGAAYKDPWLQPEAEAVQPRAAPFPLPTNRFLKIERGGAWSSPVALALGGALPLVSLVAAIAVVVGGWFGCR